MTAHRPDLAALLAVRHARWQAAENALAAALAALAAIDQEIAAVDFEHRKLHNEYKAWQRQWQHWLNHDGVLRRGQDYNHYRALLAAQGNDLWKKRSEIVKRREQAATTVAAARQAAVKCRHRLDHLTELAAAAKRSARRQRWAREDRAVEEFNLLVSTPSR